ncbi:MAG: ABC transporter ATP-binding protein [Clostridium sp.]|nr:ABC transporter ATP-binding protein [Clostridium sp.]
MKRYFKYIKPYLPYFIIGPIMMICEVIASIQLPALVADIINNGAAAGDISYIINSGVKMVVIICIAIITGVGAAYCAAKASVSFASDLRADIFKKIQMFSFSNIDKFSTGSLITRLTNDVTQVQNVVNLSLRLMLRAPGMLIGGIIMAFSINKTLAMIFIIIVPVLSIAICGIIKAAFPKFNLMQKKIDILNSNVQEALTNIRVIKSFVREDFEEHKFEKSNEELKESSLSAFRTVIIQTPIMTLAMNIATLAVVWYGGKMVMVKDIPIGDITAFITYITQILMSLNMLTMILLQCTRSASSLRRINEIFNTTVDLADSEEVFKCKYVVTKGEVTFKNISFKYYKDNKEKVLDNINLSIKGGEVVGIIGSTGCGKSTLVQLIPRLYDVDEGEVLIDGINVKKYSLKNLREAVGMVLQKNVLFSGTINENLMWGNDGATQKEIKDMANAAEVGTFIESLGDGYETELEQGGVNLSGGQKQRICIARTLLRKPKILILDDSTSAVDTATESKIRDSLKNHLNDTTKIIIAQRISSVRDSDKIIVMDDGVIVGVGTHEELLNMCPTYSEIYYSQMDKEVTA